MKLRDDGRLQVILLEYAQGREAAKTFSERVTALQAALDEIEAHLAGDTMRAGGADPVTVEACARVAEREQRNWVTDSDGYRAAGYIARYIRTPEYVAHLVASPPAPPTGEGTGMKPGQRCTLAAGHRVDYPHEHYADVELSWETDHTRVLPRCPYVEPPKEDSHGK